MAVKVTLYRQTGFSPTKLAANIQVVEDAAYSKIEIEAIDVVTVFGLSNIRVRGFERDLATVDYAVIHSETSAYQTNDRGVPFDRWDVCYSVTGYAPVATDVWELSIVPDPVATLGTSLFINAVSGRVVRSTEMSVNTKTMLIDDMLRYTKPPRYVYHPTVNLAWPYTGINETILVASAIELEEIPPLDEGSSRPNSFYDVDIEEFNPGVYKGSVKDLLKPVPVTKPTDVHFLVPPVLRENTVNFDPVPVVVSTGYYALYLYTSEIAKRIATVRKWGMDDAILGAYRVPSTFIDGSSAVFDTSYMSPSGAKLARIDSRCTSIDFSPANPHAYTSGIDYNFYKAPFSAAIANLLYQSPDFKVGVLASNTGERAERRATEFLDCVVMADIRPNGNPLYGLRRRAYGSQTQKIEWGNTVGTLVDGSVAGATWERQPITYTEASGAGKANYMLSLEQRLANEQAQMQLETGAIGAMGAALSFGAASFNDMSYVQGNITQTPAPLPYFDDNGNVVGGAMQTAYTPGTVNVSSPSILKAGAAAAGGIISTAVMRQNIIESRTRDAQRAINQYMMAYKVVPPQVVSRPAEGMQQITKNTALLYATYPDEQDLIRMGKFVGNFGIACDVPLREAEGDTELFGYPFSRFLPTKKPGDQPYVYLKTKGVVFVPPQGSGERNIPKALLEDLSNVFEIGVQVWYERPRSIDWANEYTKFTRLIAEYD